MRGSPFHTQANAAISRPRRAPFAAPTVSSLKSALRLFFHLSSPRAIPRTITVRVWLPALPPSNGTMGMNTARIAKRAMDSS